MKTLDDVFVVGHFFSPSLRTDIRKLQQLLDEGFVKMAEVSLPTIPEERLERGFLTRREPIDRWQRIGMFSGGDEHQHICARAALWLEERGLDWQDGNCLYYPGGVADVLSSDGSIAVEAGYTNVTKIIEALYAKVSVLVVPYLERDLLGYFFEPLRELPEREDLFRVGAETMARLLQERREKKI